MTVAFEPNKDGMRKFEQQMQKHFAEAIAAAAKEDSLDRKVRAFAAVLRKRGLKVDERDIRKRLGG